ncbi:MAG: hypothetical protein AB1782_06685 [Cyanobacteriota bacterium]
MRKKYFALLLAVLFGLVLLNPVTFADDDEDYTEMNETSGVQGVSSDKSSIPKQKLQEAVESADQAKEGLYDDADENNEDKPITKSQALDDEEYQENSETSGVQGAKEGNGVSSDDTKVIKAVDESEKAKKSLFNQEDHDESSEVSGVPGIADPNHEATEENVKEVKENVNVLEEKKEPCKTTEEDEIDDETEE